MVSAVTELYLRVGHVNLYYSHLTSQQMIELILATARGAALRYLDIGANKGNLPQHIISLAEANLRTFKIGN